MSLYCRGSLHGPVEHTRDGRDGSDATTTVIEVVARGGGVRGVHRAEGSGEGAQKTRRLMFLDA